MARTRRIQCSVSMADNPLDSKEYVLDALDDFAFEEGPPGREDVPPTRTPARKFIKRAKEKSASPGKRPRSATKGRTPKREALQRHRGFPPSVGECPRVLILGSAPCEMSLEKGQFYGNPRNHFWAVMAYAMDDPQFPMLDFETRCSVLRSRGIALWNICDVFTRYKSSDATLHCEGSASPPSSPHTVVVLLCVRVHRHRWASAAASLHSLHSMQRHRLL
ncbi:hypothetical protein FOZ63_026827 [Perkinsus olseni]|uniref:Uncharacterized protein n=1 Tax=Perkinsus olseni TaxID=32597 RepID=A0A7J6SYY4_PEROL|nr:hypothetical protein FOZ63_026827 [Perkinsus olseni]